MKVLKNYNYSDFKLKVLENSEYKPIATTAADKLVIMMLTTCYGC